MKRFKIYIFLILWMVPATRLMAHGYIFRLDQEEMRENIRIDIHRQYVTVMYESVYMGQIAPHTRLMIDTNADSVLSRQEIDNFFENYRESLNDTLKDLPIRIGDRKLTMQLMDVFAPTLSSDSLLAPLRLTMLFSLGDVSINSGPHEMMINPKLFFANGNHLLEMAENRVAFTRQQKEDIGRYLQIKVFASDGIEFISTYPGRLKHGNRMVYIYGVFFDENFLRVQRSQAPEFRIKFETP